MYYYAGQDQSINFRDVVNGAVHTMGKGVTDQVEDKSEHQQRVKKQLRKYWIRQASNCNT